MQFHVTYDLHDKTSEPSKHSTDTAEHTGLIPAPNNMGLVYSALLHTKLCSGKHFANTMFASATAL